MVLGQRAVDGEGGGIDRAVVGAGVGHIGAAGVVTGGDFSFGAPDALTPLPPQEVLDHTANLYQPGTRRPYGLMEWPALLRKLDRLDPSYKT